MIEAMPQLILLSLVGAAAWLGFKQMAKDAEKVSARNRQSEAEVRNGAQGTLVRGPDGVYRVRKD